MQRATGQYDHLAGVPRTGPRQSSGRRSFASRHWCRATPRRSRRMEPTVRNPRIESALEAARSSPLGGRFPERRPVSSPKFSRRERNFWMRRLEAENRPERPLMWAETGIFEKAARSPQKRSLFDRRRFPRGLRRTKPEVRKPKRGSRS